MDNIQSQRQADFVKAFNAVETLLDIAKRDPMIIIAVGLILLLVGLIAVL